MEISAEFPDGEVRSVLIDESTTATDVLNDLEMPNALIEFEGETIHPDKEIVSIGISSGDILRLKLTEAQEAVVAVKMMNKTCDGETLIRAVVDNDLKLIKSLLVAGVPGDWKDSESNLTAAHYAALDSNISVLRLLTKYGADMSAQDCTGKTPLHYASLSKKGVPKKTVEFLCGECGVDPESVACGETPLIIACRENNLPVVISLVGFGASVNNNTTFVSPLQAAPSDATYLIKYLRGQGAI